MLHHLVILPSGLNNAIGSQRTTTTGSKTRLLNGAHKHQDGQSAQVWRFEWIGSLIKSYPGNGYAKGMLGSPSILEIRGWGVERPFGLTWLYGNFTKQSESLADITNGITRTSSPFKSFLKETQCMALFLEMAAD